MGISHQLFGSGLLVSLVALFPAATTAQFLRQMSIGNATSGRQHLSIEYFDPIGSPAGFGGFDITYLDETLTSHGACVIAHAGPGPSARSQYGLAHDWVHGKLVLFGGFDGSNLGDMWEWDGCAWGPCQMSGDVPSARRAATMVYDRQRRQIFLFGGSDSAVLGDTRVATWNGSEWAWTLLSSGGGPNEPAPRAGHRIAYDSAREVVVLFGGHEGAQQFGDTWEWNGSWSLVSTSGPSPRRDHGLAYDVRRGKCVLVGGAAGVDVQGAQFNDETWEWNGSTATWRMTTSGQFPARSAFAMTYDACRDRCLIFAGASANGPLGDVWEYDGHCRADLNGDGMVDITDLALMLSNFGCTAD